MCHNSQAKQQYRDGSSSFLMGHFTRRSMKTRARAPSHALPGSKIRADKVCRFRLAAPTRPPTPISARLVSFRVAICASRLQEGQRCRRQKRGDRPRLYRWNSNRCPSTSRSVRRWRFFFDILRATCCQAPAKPSEPDVIGVALLDLTTGEFSCAEYVGRDGLRLADEVRRAAARNRGAGRLRHQPCCGWWGPAERLPVTRVEAWTFEQAQSSATLIDPLISH